MGFKKFLLKESAVKNETRAIADRSSAMISRLIGKPIINMGEIALNIDGTKYKGLHYIVGKEWTIAVALSDSGVKYVMVYIGARITNLSRPKYTIDVNGIDLFTFIRTCKNLLVNLLSNGTLTKAIKAGTIEYFTDIKASEDLGEGVIIEAREVKVDGKFFETQASACEYLLMKGMSPKQISEKIGMALPNISKVKKRMEEDGTLLKKVKVSPKDDSPTVAEVPTSEQEVIGNKIEGDEVKVERLYKKMGMYIGSILDKKFPSLIISGDPGIGKTHTLEDMLKQRGLTPARVIPVKVDKPEEEEPEEDEVDMVTPDKKRGRPKKEEIKDVPDYFTVEGDYVKYTGKITVAGLYRTLCKFRHKLIILDDCDSIWKQPDGVNILKGALDSKPRREISYPVAGTVDVNPDDDEEISAVLADGKIPTQVVFDGQMIFITNLSLKEIDPAILSRIFFVNVRLSSNQILMRIKQRYNELPEGIPNSGSAKAQEKALAFFDEIFEKTPNWQPHLERFNFRTFSKASVFIDQFGDALSGGEWEAMLMEDLEGRIED